MKQGKGSLDQIAEFQASVVRNVPLDLEPSVMQGWIDNPRALASTLRRTLAPERESASGTYPVTVDYAHSLKEMIAAGQYDWVNPDITAKNFPVTGEGAAEVSIELVHFNRYIESDEAVREFDRMGFRPATIEELLAFGAKYKDVQRQFPIVAFGSVRHILGFRYVPYLWSLSRERNLYLCWFGSRWVEIYRFAAVRK